MEDNGQDKQHFSAEESVSPSGTPLPVSDPSPESGKKPKKTLKKRWKAVREWLSMAFKKVKYGLSKAWKYVKTKGRRISPAFLVMLGLSLLMWYTIQLQGEYTTAVPFRLNIDGTRVKAEVVIRATGYQIISQRRLNRKEVDLSWGELEITPSAVNSRAVAISPLSLQNIISLRYPKLTIVSMGNIPEVEQ